LVGFFFGWHRDRIVNADTQHWQALQPHDERIVSAVTEAQ